MDSSTLKNGLQSRKQLEGAIRLYQNYLEFEGNPFALLMALSANESDYGLKTNARFEYGYSRNSIAFKRSKLLQEGHDNWGDLAACSYGPFQILWITAREMGLPPETCPIDLIQTEFSLPYVIKCLNKLVQSGAKTIDQLLGCYNGGLGALRAPNAEVMKYAAKGRKIYETFLVK